MLVGQGVWFLVLGTGAIGNGKYINSDQWYWPGMSCLADCRSLQLPGAPCLPASAFTPPRPTLWQGAQGTWCRNSLCGGTSQKRTHSDGVCGLEMIVAIRWLSHQYHKYPLQRWTEKQNLHEWGAELEWPIARDTWIPGQLFSKEMASWLTRELWEGWRWC